MDYIFSNKTVVYSDESAIRAKTYKYKGGDLSYMYKYILKPIAELMVKFTPSWVSPNWLTLIGAMWLVIPHFVTLAIYGQKYEGDMVWYALPLYYMCFFIYVCFDNSDGV